MEEYQRAENCETQGVEFKPETEETRWIPKALSSTSLR